MSRAEHRLELRRRVGAMRAGGDQDGDVAVARCPASPQSAASISRRGCARVMSQTEIATVWPRGTALAAAAGERRANRRDERRVRIGNRRRDDRLDDRDAVVGQFTSSPSTP